VESMVHDIVLEEDALQIEDLEERSELISGVCACTCSCGCTSTSCVAWA
jgi:hypothetical protein